MLILGIESSCDETAAAVVADGERIRSSVVASQVLTHEKYGGVVPNSLRGNTCVRSNRWWTRLVGRRS